ncbi:MAG: ATP-dependent DNA helicase RecG [Acidobacteriota bacterium]|jgi:ATP-dependent DNA helicase RecG|nr:ATP-dependent DNA helicase RecG [Acidobacteriota bacterium]
MKPVDLEAPVQFLKSIGPKRSEMLAAHGIRTIGGLLEHLPFRYEDRSRFRSIASLRAEEWVLIRGRVSGVAGTDGPRRGFSIFEMRVRDEPGSILVKFFNQPYLRRLYTVGTRLALFGQVRQDSYSGGALVLMNPECEILEDGDDMSLHSGRIVPVYRKLGDLRTRTLRQILYLTLSHAPSEMPDALPAYLVRKFRLPSKIEAMRLIHFPVLCATAEAEREKELRLYNAGISRAHKRFIFEELFQFQVAIQMSRKRRVRHEKTRRIAISENIRTAIKKILPFHPTEAQKRALKEIADDQCSRYPMSRLLQGDVGSGKTIVAAQAAVIAVENGCQAAIMAPTEILAEQHYFYFKRLFSPIGYSIDLLKGSLKAKEKKLVRERIRGGETRIIIGTHALVEESVEFGNLGLVVIDEQHRFGVVQRGLLREKGNNPDILVMTATPIPRSLALTLYGDLDVSVINQLPPGRKPIETAWFSEKEREKAYHAIRHTADSGRQVYIVYPLVEESEKSDLRAAVDMAEHLKNNVFPDCRVGLLHGRMKSVEKEETMRAFAAGDIQILVATTVIEVGVDVPNATLMVIEHAERFGLAQLHQLRGRVGRGGAQSHCLLIGNAGASPEVRRRMEIMCETNDGFKIAQADLELRGPGEIFGTRQSGLPAFRYADIVRDIRALEIAREEAAQFLDRLRDRPDGDCRRAAEIILARWNGLTIQG